MKKFLSLVLAVMMLLGCVSITAFAEGGYDLYINDVQVDTEGEITNAAITDGTVTYTAAEHNNGIAKLTLNGAVIQALNDGQDGISTEESDLIIELIGENTVTVDGLGISVFGNLTFIGDGSLTISSDCEAIGAFGNITFSMSGAVTATASNSSGISAENGIIVTAGAGKVTAHGSGVAQFEYAGISIGTTDGVVSGCQTIIGSANSDETDESNMTNATLNSRFVLDKFLFDKVFMVGDSVAKTVVLTSYPTPKSGNTDITLTVAKALTYDMVIPEDVTNLNAAGIYSVGQAKATNVKNATDKTVISYTAETTAFKCEGKTDIPATYYTDAQGAAAFPTTAVEVYKSKADAASIPTMYVGISETDWNAAENGTYTATVTFNFEAEEEEEKNEWVITFDGADLGNVEVNMPYVFTAATAEGATAATPVTYTIEEGGSYYSIGDDLYGDPNKMNIYVLDECPYDQVTITVTYPEDDIHRETSKSAVFTYKIVG